jgi:hypothetical protein
VLGRHLPKMTRRILVISIIGLILLFTGIAWYLSAARNQRPAQIISATINRDCAPWDGSAFTISVPLEGRGINISVYQSPDIKLPTSFSFQDDPMSTGNVLLILPIGSPEQLTGRVYFQRVSQDVPVEGTFDLVTKAGEHFKGKFIAEWGNEIIYCG